MNPLELTVQRRLSRRSLRAEAAISKLSSVLPHTPEERALAGGNSTADLLSSAGCDVFVRIDTVVALVGLSVPTIYRLMSKKDFPRPVKLTAAARGWRLSELIVWMRGREVEGNSSERVST